MLRKSKILFVSSLLVNREFLHVAYFGNWLFRIQSASCLMQMASTVSSASHYCLYTSVFSENKRGAFFLCKLQSTLDSGKMVILLSTWQTVIYPLSYTYGWKCCFHLEEWCKLMRMGAFKHKREKEKISCIKPVIEKKANFQKEKAYLNIFSWPLCKLCNWWPLIKFALQYSLVKGRNKNFHALGKKQHTLLLRTTLLILCMILRKELCTDPKGTWITIFQDQVLNQYLW